LTGILEYKDGSSFRGTSGTSANGEKSYYYINDRHKISIGAEKLEKAVIDSLACFKDDEEVQGYAKEAIQQMASGFEIIDDQVRTLRTSLGEIKKRELGLIDALSTGAKIENVSAWLQDQLGTIKDERTEVERSIERLEREKAAIEAHSPSARNMKKTLSYVFEHFGKAEPSVQRNFIRQVFDKIVVCEKNVIKLFWRFADCDAGGEKFALGREWGD
jgi:prefoldin subunit 5